MRRKSVNGNRSAGLRLKKSPQGGPHHRLHRRERTERAAPPLPYLGPERTDTGVAVPLVSEIAGQLLDSTLMFRLVSRWSPSRRAVGGIESGAVSSGASGWACHVQLLSSRAD